MYDHRAVRMVDDTVQVISDMSPTLTLAHSGIGAVDRSGMLLPLEMPTPDDFLTATYPEVSPGFTHYAFLDDQTTSWTPIRTISSSTPSDPQASRSKRACGS